MILTTHEVHVKTNIPLRTIQRVFAKLKAEGSEAVIATIRGGVFVQVIDTKLYNLRKFKHRGVGRPVNK